MTEEEFMERFRNRILELARGGLLQFNQDPLDYASSAGPTYWRERFPEGLSPEQCAEEDAAFWDAQAEM